MTIIKRVSPKGCKTAWDIDQWLKCLPDKHRVLSLIPSTAKKKKQNEHKPGLKMCNGHSLPTVTAVITNCSLALAVGLKAAVAFASD